MRFNQTVIQVSLLYLLSISLILSSCQQSTDLNKVVEQKSISKSEIIAFQESYGISFNSISKAIDNNSYYETAAKEHINKYYNFNEGEVMFKLGHNDAEPYRSTYEGVLSYLIGKNNDFPNDEGIAKDNWRKIDWQNDWIINDFNQVAIIMGKVKMIRENKDVLNQNFTMCLKRDSKGELKLIAHKIFTPCD